MRPAARLLVRLCLPAILAAAGGDAMADETALSYAPAATPMAPMIGEAHAYGSEKQFEPPRERVCFNPTETRDKIAAHRLAEPFRAMRMGRLQGDALRAKLCRWKPDQFVYEIAVLRRDGRVVHVYMNALNGQDVGPGEAERR